MQDHHSQASRVSGDSLTPPCAYCAEESDAADGWPPERLPRGDQVTVGPGSVLVMRGPRV